MSIMSQGKRVTEELPSDVQSTKSVAVKKTAKKRGRINVNACFRCRRDKKKCDGNYSTKESCRYCRHHKVECSYPEPGRKRAKVTQRVEDIKIKIKEQKKSKRSTTKIDPIKDIHARMIKVEENLSGVTELLTNNVYPRENIKDVTKQLISRLILDQSISDEESYFLRKLWFVVEKIISKEEYLRAIYINLRLSENAQGKDRSQVWKDIQNLVDRHNDTGNTCENESSVHPLTPTLNPDVIPPEFINNNTDDFYIYPILNVPKTSVQDPFVMQTTHDNIKIKSSPIVPSQPIKNRRGDYQEGEAPLFTLQSIFDNFDDNFPICVNPNSPHIFVENDYLGQLTSDETTFPQPTFPTTPTFNSLQPSPSHNSLNEFEHSYSIIPPTNDYNLEYPSTLDFC